MLSALERNPCLRASTRQKGSPRHILLGIPLERHTKLTDDMKLLAKRRNEGAHEFALGVRDGYFTEVEYRYVPALNILLIAIDYPKG
jgi:hypothetical protein